MSQPVSATNRRIEEERRTKYCGTASLRVDSLSFSHQKNLRFGDEAARNTAVLARIFREEDGLRQEDAQNHITAIINPQVLETALASCNIDGSSLMRNILPYPQLELPVGVSLECLQGHDRLAAANDVFKGSDQRWIVDLYLDDLSDDLKQMLTDDYKHQRKPCDGEIYYKIREYQGICGTANSFFEKLWYGRLTVSKSRREKFQQLLGHAEYLAAFDKFLQMPALLTDLRITVLHEIMSMQCDEPILNYLAHTWIWWFKLCEGNFDSMQRIDRHTIEMLQGKAPGASKHDRDTLLVCFRNRELFSNIPEQHRDGFWDRTLENSRVGLIPSLFTFFEDRKFLHRVSESMRYILDVNGRIGVAGALSSAFQNSANDSTMEPCTIQWSDYHFTTIPGNETTRKALGARQLWLYAFREYENLPPISRKKNLLAKSRTKFDEQVLYDFAVFALQLGFQTVKIDKILSRSIDCDIAERALDAARKPEAYEYGNKPQLITQMVNMFAAAQPVSTKPLLEQQHAAEPRLPPTRYGLPEATDHTRDKSLLFLPQMKAASAGSIMNHVSSFFVRTSVYLAFFGDFPELPELRMPEEPALIAAHTKRIDNDHDMELCEESLPTSPVPVRKGQDSSRPQSARMQPHEAQNFEFGSGFVGELIELSPPSVTRADESQPSMSTELAKALGELNGLRDTVAREQVKLDVIKNQIEEEQAVLDAKKQDMQILIEKEDTLSSQVQQLGLASSAKKVEWS
ncbi:uncharacterized protein BBA_10074 [Beauveria bassiana ARSEF 2860]|uniref:Uncharacterized protein n=1 Tax=Beauveria bassiana (strain ARSEF 2860) TaxID=655819 RepID=J4VQL9_BEAB2|nr:uncharacterized protein BBA_10074 [Beauveria bassiana ARSEF 2860]EJP60975.1 hypothetical protein BBA_10074 [Beauveria bassiana ARSEF 2860]